MSKSILEEFVLEVFVPDVIVLEAAEAVYYTSLWLLHNNYVLQMYSHAATIAFM